MSAWVGNIRYRSTSLSAVMVQLLPAAFLCFLFAAVGILHVTSRVRSVGVGYELSVLEAEHRELSRENARLKLELATLKSPLRLERYAREHLGMAPPPASSIVLLPSPKPKSSDVAQAPVAQLQKQSIPKQGPLKEDAQR